MKIDRNNNEMPTYEYAMSDSANTFNMSTTAEEHEDRNGYISVPFARPYVSNEHILWEFDPDHLDKGENQQISYVTRKYAEFYTMNGYIPRYFNAYDCREIKDIAPALTTQCGSKSGTGAIVCFYLWEEIAMLISDETKEIDEVAELVKKLLRIAAPEERKKAEDMLLKIYIAHK